MQTTVTIIDTGTRNIRAHEQEFLLSHSTNLGTSGSSNSTRALIGCTIGIVKVEHVLKNVSFDSTHYFFPTFFTFSNRVNLMFQYFSLARSFCTLGVLLSKVTPHDNVVIVCNYYFNVKQNQQWYILIFTKHEMT